MLAYGYEWGGEEEKPLSLREASLVCSREELEELIAMLQAFRAQLPEEAEGDHQHYRDWSDSWTGEHSDFILLISDQPWTKENHN